MSHSHFVNAWGNGNAGQKVTARDMAHLAAYVIGTYPQFYHYFGETEFTWNGIRQENRNPLLSMNIGADGLKTGHLAASGYGLVGSAVQRRAPADRGPLWGADGSGKGERRAKVAGIRLSRGRAVPTPSTGAAPALPFRRREDRP